MPEQRISNLQVTGSNPVGRAILRKMLRMVNQKFNRPDGRFNFCCTNLDENLWVRAVGERGP